MPDVWNNGNGKTKKSRLKKKSRIDMSSEESSVHSDYGSEEDLLGKRKPKTRGRPKKE